MRMSRRMGLLGSMKMNPSEVVVNSGSRTQYWASASETSDQWHNINSGGLPFTNDTAYWGENNSGCHHNLALCFKTPSFKGKGKAFRCQIRATSKWGWTTGLNSMWQLSMHDWSSAEAWKAGSKSYYSQRLTTTAPDDPNAVAHGSFKVNHWDSYWVEFEGEARLLPDTEYVLYVWGSATSNGKLVEVAKTSSTQPIITITG